MTPLGQRAIRALAFTTLAAGVGFTAVGVTMATRASSVTAQAATAETSITSITATCSSDGRTCGALTVANPIAGETITLHVTAHTPGSAVFMPLAGTDTVVTLVADQTTYDFCITIPAADLSAGFNTFRVEVASTSDPMTGTTTKSDSFSCTGSTPTPTPASTPTATVSPASTPTPTPTATVSPASTPTPTATPAAGVLGISTGAGGAVTTPNTGAALPIGTGLVLMATGLALLAQRRRADR